METLNIPWERGLTDLNILEMSLEDAVYLSVSDHLREHCFACPVSQLLCFSLRGCACKFVLHTFEFSSQVLKFFMCKDDPLIPEGIMSDS